MRTIRTKMAAMMISRRKRISFGVFMPRRWRKLEEVFLSLLISRAEVRRKKRKRRKRKEG